jgi:hypothetical protein
VDRRRPTRAGTAIARQSGPFAAPDDLILAGEDDQRLAFMEEAVPRFPEDPRVRLRYVNALIPVEHDKVGDELRRVIALGPDSPEHVYRAASLIIDHGQVETAWEWVQRANELAPRHFRYAADRKC